MTVTTASSKIIANGNDVTTVFPFTFAVFQESDLGVILTNASNVETLQTITTHYTVQLNADQDTNPGGTVTAVTAPATGEKWTVYRDIASQQQVDLQNQGAYYPEVVEDALDRLTMLIQELEERVDRVPKLQISDTSGDFSLGTPVANAVIQYNSAGDGMESSGIDATQFNTDVSNTATNASNAATSASNASTSESNAATSESNAATSESNAATSETNAEAAWDSFDDKYLGEKSSAPALDNDGNALQTGALYWDNVVDKMYVYDGALWQLTSAASQITVTEVTATAAQTVFTVTAYTAGFELVYLNGNLLSAADYTTTNSTTITLTEAAELNDEFRMISFEAISTADNAPNLSTRNGVLNQEPVSQGTSTRRGMVTVIWSGNATSPRSIDGAIDLSTGDFGGLVWTKRRTGGIISHALYDTVRGVGERIRSDATSAENNNDANGYLSAFGTTGFELTDGASSDDLTNNSGDDYVAWCFQTNKIESGTTNGNKSYTAHYNADMGFSIVGYAGDGTNVHEIPHHLGRAAELTIIKNRDAVTNWAVSSPFAGSPVNGDYLQLDTNNALNTGVSTLETIFMQDTTKIGSSTFVNTNNENYIQYNFVSVPGVSKIGSYVGTGAAGNYISCGFKPAFVMVKNMTSGENWIIQDAQRSDNRLTPNSSDAESGAGVHNIDFVADGFVCTSTGSNVNALNAEFIFIAFAETGTDATRAWSDYDYPTAADTLSINQNSLISFAEGFGTLGQIDSQENVGAGITFALGATHEDKHYYLYKDKGGSYGVTENRPLVGVTRDDADKYGVVSPLDATLRTTSRHFDYESDSGVALASSEFSSLFEAWEAFQDYDRDTASDYRWASSTSTDEWLQYKHTEKRILKSWRFREGNSADHAPLRFVIEGSNDGNNWTEIDVTYKVSTGVNYSGNGAELWGDIQSTSGNTTAYLYHRIFISTVNGGSIASIATMEFNTILPSDYYLVNEGVMYDSTGTPISRTYLAEVWTDGDGDVIRFENFAPGKLIGGDAELQGDVKIYGEIQNPLAANAIINYDGTVNPPLVRSSHGDVLDVVDAGTGTYEVIFGQSISLNGCTHLAGGRVAGGHAEFRIDPLDNHRLGVLTGNSDTTTDASDVTIAIFGGKKWL